MRHIKAGLLAAVLFFFSFLSCAPLPEKEAPLRVVVTILPLAGFVEAVGGERVEVSVLVPPGADAHTYEPRPGDLREVRRARMYVEVGSGLEFEEVWGEKLRELNKEMLVVSAAKKDEEDPHVWLAVSRAREMVENIFLGLVELDPEHADYYSQRKEAYLSQLALLEDEIRAALAPFKGKPFFVFHAAWGCFARAYGLRQVPLELGEKEPATQDFFRVVTEAKREGAAVFFASPYGDLEKAKAVAAKVGGEVVILDPLARDYLANMRSSLEKFVNALR